MADLSRPLNCSFAQPPDGATLYLVVPARETAVPLTALTRMANVQVQRYQSIEGFLSTAAVLPPCCVLVSVACNEELRTLVSGMGQTVRAAPLLIWIEAEYQPALTLVSTAFAGCAAGLLQASVDTSKLIYQIVEALWVDERERRRHQRIAELAHRFAGLSKREQQVMDQLVRGHSAVDIARILHVSAKTVENHLARIRRKSNAPNTRILLAQYLELQLRCDSAWC